VNKKRLKYEGNVKQNRGLNTSRLIPSHNNPREIAFAEEWERQNVDQRGVNYGFGILQDLFLQPPSGGLSIRNDRKCRARITKRDRFIVATVIQWLGSNCGMGLLHAALHNCGYRIVKVEEKTPATPPCSDRYNECLYHDAKQAERECPGHGLTCGANVPGWGKAKRAQGIHSPKCRWPNSGCNCGVNHDICTKER